MIVSSLNFKLILTRWFGLVRLWQPWLAPRQGRYHFQLDKDGIMLSFLSNHGKHIVLLAISGRDDVMTVFKDDGNGRISLHVSRDMFLHDLISLDC